MTIKVWDYLLEFEHEESGSNLALAKVFGSGRLILGESVKTFEERFAAYCGVQHGVGVNSGTDALFLGLKALGVQAGDEVITVPNTAVPTVSAIVSAGGTPRFVDVHPDTLLMDVSAVGAALTPRVKCVLPVHLYGQCVDMTALTRVTRERGIPYWKTALKATAPSTMDASLDRSATPQRSRSIPRRYWADTAMAVWSSPMTGRCGTSCDVYVSTGWKRRTTPSSTATTHAWMSFMRRSCCASSTTYRPTSSVDAS